ncbi:MAG: dihydropteroate synthase, partial [Bacteroidia bacterium]|nr:dihydropteroate synthase [Bacteroidia bacterium]
PDSFYTASRFRTEKDILERAEIIVKEGGTIADVGAASSRPGAEPVPEAVELERLIPAIKNIKNHFPDLLISVDTYHSSVAERVITETGDCIINDISSGSLDPEMFRTIAKLRIPYIMMHMQGIPANMQIDPVYQDVVTDIISFFSKKVRTLIQMGVQDIVLDPGFGFGKTVDHNYQLISRLEAFQIFGLPILAGISRKSMITKHLGVTPSEALTGTISLNTIALLKGVSILRVHDVKEACDTIRIVRKYKDASSFNDFAN